MKRLTILIPLVVTLLFSVSGATLMAQNTFKTTSKSVIAFYQYLPKDYASNSNKYPVVIFLHGIGERGPNSTNKSTLEAAIPAVAKLGPPRMVRDGKHFPFILISPQLKTGIGNWPAWYVTEVIDYVKSYLRIDEKRIHITGLSLGGGGAWTMGQEHASLFASLAPVCGGYNSTSKAPNIARENLPVWAFHGDADNVVSYLKSMNMVNAINACSPPPDPRAKLTIYPGVKHDSWNRAYATDHSYHNPNVYEWMMSKYRKRKGSNSIPTANAGSDKSISSGSKVTLSGSGSDSDGSIASYRWTKISGPSASIASPGSSSTTVSGLSAGTYYFRLQVTDSKGATDSDYVRVTVGSSDNTGGEETDGSTTNKVPVANAGPNVTITLPVNKATITGSGSDPDGSIVSYQWTKLKGGQASLSGANTSRLYVSNVIEGTYIFRLTVKDDKGAVKYDDMALYVKAGSTSDERTAANSVNQPPIASAGTDRVVKLPVSYYNIPGSGRDADGSIRSYQWTRVSGPWVSLSNTTSSTLRVNSPGSGTFVFRLTVTDDKGATHTDDVKVTFNQPPKSWPGNDVNKPYTSTYTIVGKGSDSDGQVVKYQWIKVSGPSASVSGQSTPNLRMTNMVSGTYVWRLTVTDNNNHTDSDEIKLVFGN